MPLSIKIEDRSHRVIRTLSSDELIKLADFSMSLPSSFLIRGIDPWDDTVFNLLQMKLLRNEIAQLRTDMPNARGMLDFIDNAVSEAMAGGGYIRFAGD
jgi:hypothetical protein